MVWLFKKNLKLKRKGDQTSGRRLLSSLMLVVFIKYEIESIQTVTERNPYRKLKESRKASQARTDS